MGSVLLDGACSLEGIIMAKSSLEREIEKQRRDAQKAARDEEVRSTAQNIVNGAKYISGFRIMDSDSEKLFQYVLDQYDGNEDNHVNFDSELLPTQLQDSLSVGFEKLKMYGVVLRADLFMSGALVTLSESGKEYFRDKQEAYNTDFSTQLEGHSTILKEYDVFISHASQDKLPYVDDLYRALSRLGIKIWYDTEVISWGDSFKDKILEGTAISEFAIIVISEEFFDREWTEKELNAFLQRQNETGQKIILPILYNISLDDLKRHYHDLADIQVVFSEKTTVEEIAVLFAKELIKRLKECK